MNKNTNYFNGLAGIPVIFLFFMLFSFAVAAAEPIARVIVSSGHFTAVQPDGKERVLKRRSAIFEGDTLITAEDARAQIRFKDGALIDIQAATQLRLDEYNYQGQVDGTEKNTMSLIKGGFRTITGVVGKKNKKNYKVNTPVATIGIRGTHYGLHYCGSDCGVDTGNGQQNKKGLFGGVVDGAVVANNDSGEIRLGNDEYFHVASKSAEPKVLLVPPAIIFKGSELQVTASMTKETGDSGATTTETVFTEEVAVSENYEVAYSDPDTGEVTSSFQEPTQPVVELTTQEPTGDTSP
ncbi:MAG: FecR family protein, partial [Gammaproteobacteria bacterium]|nr:FecR family protein [Gammaproteobacteria bacterium]